MGGPKGALRGVTVKGGGKVSIADNIVCDVWVFKRDVKRESEGITKERKAPRLSIP